MLTNCYQLLACKYMGHVGNNRLCNKTEGTTGFRKPHMDTCVLNVRVYIRTRGSSVSLHTTIVQQSASSIVGPYQATHNCEA